ncbi:hypothetical protein BAC3_00473 [uncultured bacterium]|nr:hypothetical protein BAC3_00473 [uncultured bacterium]
MTKITNLFTDIPEYLPNELFTPLLQQNDIVIERIVSQGHSTPDNQWYDQEQDEWVIVLQGQAILVYENTRQLLNIGDYVLIPAHTKHRVEWTDPEQNTVWLAIHIYPKHQNLIDLI